jgi:hypothetical protein
MIWFHSSNPKGLRPRSLQNRPTDHRRPGTQKGDGTTQSLTQQPHYVYFLSFACWEDPLTMWRSTSVVVLSLISCAVAFVPSSFVHHHSNGLFQPHHPTTTATERSLMMMVDSSSLLDATSASMGIVDAASQLWQQSSSSSSLVASLTDAGGALSPSASSNLLLSFADQGQNLAGIFFQASLLPYLLFLYFLAFRGNRISDVGNFGFQFVLLFVFFTIPSGIISKATYGETLANVDWLHGGAELFLTICNILIVRIVYESWIEGEANTHTQ